MGGSACTRLWHEKQRDGPRREGDGEGEGWSHPAEPHESGLSHGVPESLEQLEAFLCQCSFGLVSAEQPRGWGRKPVTNTKRKKSSGRVQGRPLAQAGDVREGFLEGAPLVDGSERHFLGAW